MYAIDRQVFVRSLGQVGRISERNYEGAPRHATYVVTFEDGFDFLTRSGDLRPADWQCDGCNGWRSGNPTMRDPDVGWFCWLCVGPSAQERHYREMYQRES